MKRVLAVIVSLTLLCILIGIMSFGSRVSADELWVDDVQVPEGTEYTDEDEVIVVIDYNGVRIGFDPRVETKEYRLSVLDENGAPPAFPSEASSQLVVFKNQDSSDALPTPTYDFTDEEYWFYT